MTDMKAIPHKSQYLVNKILFFHVNSWGTNFDFSTIGPGEHFLFQFMRLC